MTRMKLLNRSVAVRPGVYRHYKGQLYRVLETVRHSETLEELVLYKALYENRLGALWVRPKAMFLETVLVKALPVPRFQYLGRRAPREKK